ncbi:MAG: hypothetical protein NVS3B21_25710 [Acidimicrobiales bacterium]
MTWVEGIGDYLFTGALGEGGGSVWLADPPDRLDWNEPVAVKLGNVPIDAAVFAKFASALGVVAAGRPSHIIPFLEIGRQVDGSWWITMARADGGSVAAPRSRLTAPQLVSLAADAAHGAHAFHEVGIVHGRINSGNILIADGGRLGEPDLDRLVAPGRSVTAVGTNIPTESVDPAVARGSQPGRASDIWSLAVTLHRSLTGRSVFAGAPDRQSLLATIRFVATAAPHVDPNLPEGLSALLARCLAIHPGDRPATALEMAQQLDGLASSVAELEVPDSASSPMPAVAAPVAVRAGVAATVDLRKGNPQAASPLPTTADSSPRSTTVKGLRCARRHFNRPTASYCSSCGLSMLQQTHILVEGPRPPLGILVLDDGSAVSLDADYLIGREPGGDSRVARGDLRPLTLRGTSVSGVHAEVRLDGWRVLVNDLGSTNGTFVAAPGAQGWTRLGSEPVELEPGFRIAAGGTTMVFESTTR